MNEIIKLQIRILLDGMDVFLFAQFVLTQKMILNWKRIAIAAGIILFSKIGVLWMPECMAVILLLSLFFLYVSLFEGKFFHRLLGFGASYFFISYLDIFVCLFLSILQGKSFYLYWEEDMELVWQVVLVISLLLIMGSVIRKEEKWRNFFQKIPDVFLALITICSIFFYFYMMSSFDFAKQYENYGLQNLVIWGSVCTGIAIDFIILALYGANKLKTQYRIENELKDDYLKASKDYCNAILENEKEIRKLRHDMKGHLIAIEYYTEHEKYNELRKYLKEIDRQFMKTSRIKTTGSELIDAILAKYQEGNHQISYCVTGIFSYRGMKDYDLCVLFSNLILNAVEACERLKQEKREISISFRQVGFNHVISIGNPVEEKIECNKLGGFTSKEDKKNHGFGIQRISEVVRKYNGTVDFREENQKFIVTVILS